MFVVTGGRLATPPNGPEILPGTTRDAVLELVQDWMPCDVRPIPVDELRRAEEVWIASAGRGVLPVTSVDGGAVGNGAPGPAWRRTYQLLQQHLDEIAGRPALEDA